MSKLIHAATEIARLQAASVWVQRLEESGDSTPAEEWIAWCAEHPLNLPAFEQMQRVWGGFLTPAAAATCAVAPRRDFYRQALWGLAASLLLAVGGLSWVAHDLTHALAWNTVPGGQRRETLPDGSRLDLAPASRLSIHFSPWRREARLDHGQAYFAVVHSAVRPFVVHAGNLTTTTATGSAFDVRTGPDGTVVTVSEGFVSVVPRMADGGADVILVHAGEQMTFSAAEHRVDVADVDLRIAESWRTGVLQFVGESLQQVVAEVDRFTQQKIVLAAPLQGMRFTGTVSAANVAEWLEALKQIYPVEVVEEAANEFNIQPWGASFARQKT